LFYFEIKIIDTGEYLMDKSYLERAQQWINNADDVDIESLESTIGRFTVELEKFKFSNPMQVESKMKDLSETLVFLKGKLQEIAGVDELPLEAPLHPVQVQSLIPVNTEDFRFDPSPLVDVSETPCIVLSAEEKAGAIASIRKLPGIITGNQLVQKNLSVS
jgi:hypothetical protein